MEDLRCRCQSCCMLQWKDFTKYYSYIWHATSIHCHHIFAGNFFAQATIARETMKPFLGLVRVEEKFKILDGIFSEPTKGSFRLYDLSLLYELVVPLMDVLHTLILLILIAYKSIEVQKSSLHQSTLLEMTEFALKAQTS